MSNYKYQGIELTPAVFKDLLIQFFDGKQFSRQEAVDEIQKYHLENGGLLTKATYLATFKKAAQQLKDAGIENVGYGIWRLRYNTQKFDVTPIPAKSNDFVFLPIKLLVPVRSRSMSIIMMPIKICLLCRENPLGNVK